MLTDFEKRMLDEYFIRYEVAPTKPRFIQAISNTFPEFRVYEILGHSNNIAGEKCVAYEKYIEEILRGEL